MSNEKPRCAASGGLKPMSCHHLIEPKEAVEILALIRVMASLEGLGEHLPKLHSAGSAEVLMVFRYTDFDGGMANTYKTMLMQSRATAMVVVAKYTSRLEDKVKRGKAPHTEQIEPSTPQEGQKREQESNCSHRQTQPSTPQEG
jgi:hypothetical protein